MHNVSNANNPSSLSHHGVHRFGIPHLIRIHTIMLCIEIRDIWVGVGRDEIIVRLHSWV